MYYHAAVGTAQALYVSVAKSSSSPSNWLLPIDVSKRRRRLQWSTPNNHNTTEDRYLVHPPHTAGGMYLRTYASCTIAPVLTPDERCHPHLHPPALSRRYLQQGAHHLRLLATVDVIVAVIVVVVAVVLSIHRFLA